MTRPSDPNNLLELSAETWQQELLADMSPDDLANLEALDAETIYAALVDYTERGNVPGAEVERRSADDVPRADAALLIPGTRIHVQAVGAVRETIEKLVRMAAIFVIAGTTATKTDFVGLTVDLAIAIFDKTSRLSETEFQIVRTVIGLRKSADGTLPDTNEVVAALPEVDDVADQLTELEDDGVVTEEDGGWKVEF